MAQNPKTPNQGPGNRSGQAGNSEKNERGGAFNRGNKPGKEQEVNPDEEVDSTDESQDRPGGQAGKDGLSHRKMNTKASNEENEEDIPEEDDVDETEEEETDEELNEESEEEKDEDADDKAIGKGRNNTD